MGPHHIANKMDRYRIGGSTHKVVVAAQSEERPAGITMKTRPEINQDYPARLAEPSSPTSSSSVVSPEQRPFAADEDDGDWTGWDDVCFILSLIGMMAISLALGYVMTYMRAWHV
jgi:hypothetical protein